MRFDGPRLAWALAAAALCTTGCDEASEPDDGSTMELSDAEIMAERDLQWQSAGDVPIEGTEHLGVAEVKTMSASEARVKSERIVLGALGERVVNATIQPVGFEADEDRGVAFAMFTRSGPDAPWQSFSLPGTVDGVSVEAYTFRSIRVDRRHNSIELEVVLPSPQGLWTDHFARVVRFDAQTEIALAPAPLATWAELEGMWEYELDVRCNGIACR